MWLHIIVGMGWKPPCRGTAGQRDGTRQLGAKDAIVFHVFVESDQETLELEGAMVWRVPRSWSVRGNLHLGRQLRGG